MAATTDKKRKKDKKDKKKKDKKSKSKKDEESKQVEDTMLTNNTLLKNAEADQTSIA